jgi:hypothetical protein
MPQHRRHDRLRTFGFLVVACSTTICGIAWCLARPVQASHQVLAQGMIAAANAGDAQELAALSAISNDLSVKTEGAGLLGLGMGVATLLISSIFADRKNRFESASRIQEKQIEAAAASAAQEERTQRLVAETKASGLQALMDYRIAADTRFAADKVEVAHELAQVQAKYNAAQAELDRQVKPA